MPAERTREIAEGFYETQCDDFERSDEIPGDFINRNLASQATGLFGLKQPLTTSPVSVFVIVNRMGKRYNSPFRPQVDDTLILMRPGVLCHTLSVSLDLPQL